mgnify:CR=1 FL=1
MSIVVAEEDIESISNGGDDYTEEDWSISDPAAAPQWSIAADDTTANESTGAAGDFTEADDLPDGK